MKHANEDRLIAIGLLNFFPALTMAAMGWRCWLGYVVGMVSTLISAIVVGAK